MIKFLNRKITILNASLTLSLLILIEIVVVTQFNLNKFVEKEANSAIPIKSVSATQSPKKEVELQIPVEYGRSVIIPILTYHYIGNNPNPEDKARDNLSVAPEKFEAQMESLSAKGYSPISLDTMYAGLMGQISLPTKPIILTFDDGYIDFYHNSFPILRRLNFHATVFIPTGLMGGSYYLTWDQIKEIDTSGLISFQSHSVNHANLVSLNHDQLMYQLVESKKILETNLGKTVHFIAYPYGISSPAVWQAAKVAGYLGGLGTWYGITESEGTIYDMPRVKISGGLTIEKFASMFP